MSNEQLRKHADLVQQASQQTKRSISESANMRIRSKKLQALAEARKLIQLIENYHTTEEELNEILGAARAAVAGASAVGKAAGDIYSQGAAAEREKTAAAKAAAAQQKKERDDAAAAQRQKEQAEAARVKLQKQAGALYRQLSASGQDVGAMLDELARLHSSVQQNPSP
jgi:hypothetical protein